MYHIRIGIDSVKKTPATPSAFTEENAMKKYPFVKALLFIALLAAASLLPALFRKDSAVYFDKGKETPLTAQKIDAVKPDVVALLEKADKPVRLIVTRSRVREEKAKRRGIEIVFARKTKIVVGGRETTVKKVLIPFCDGDCGKRAPVVYTGLRFYHTPPHTAPRGEALVEAIRRKVEE